MLLRKVFCCKFEFFFFLSLFSAEYVGLVNQAMTCYLNSLLQSLFMTPEFRNALYKWEFDGRDEEARRKSIPFQLQRLFLKLQVDAQLL
jgi:ubiquitin carboxyl-terminal hydrolase 47